ncbi:uncharacterized protein [Typha latifolia]|uniref:uncharacterized protein n=1 Tax=Typha latifolia TaxID=4733 RepID=UPI003C2DB1C7
MPPAMVGLRFPAAVAAAASNQSPPRNPSKGQISAPFPTFAVESMDRSDLGLGLDGSFASPAPPFPSASAPARPSSSAGLSKPRLVKVRKHLGSGRAKPAVIADPEDSTGFNPFRPGSSGADENPRDSTAPSFVFGPGSDAGAFVFGSGAKKDYVSRENSVMKDSDGLKFCGFESVKSESSGFPFGAGSEVNFSAKNLVGDSAFCIGAERGEFSGSVYGGRVKKSSVARGNSMGKDSGGVTLGGHVPVQFEGTSFGFGAGSDANSGARSIAGNRTFSIYGEQGEVPGSVVHGSGLKEKSGYREKSVGKDLGNVNYGSFESMKSGGIGFSFGAGSATKKNVEDLMFSLGNEGKRSPRHSSFSSLVGVESEKFDSSGFIFASGSVSGFDKETMVPENKTDQVFANATKGSRNASPDVFVFGIVTEGSSNLHSESSENSEGPKFSSARSGTPETTAFAFNANAAPQAEKKNIGFVSSNTKDVWSGNVQSGEYFFAGEKGGKSDAKISVLGSGVEQNFKLHKNFSLGSDVGSFSKLPDEMGKLNLQNSGSDDGFKKTKETDQRDKMEENNSFIFGTTTDPSSSFDGVGVNMLPGEIKKLNIGSGAPSDAGVFVFGSGVKGSSYLNESSSLGSDLSSSSNIHDEMRKLNLQNSSTDYGFGKTKKTKDNNLVNDANTNDPSFFGGIEVNVLPEELKKLNIGSGTPSDARIFVFGSGVKGNSYINEDSSLGSDGSSNSKLPNEMKKLNLQNSGSADGFEKTKQTDQRAKMDGKNNFMFGANTNASSSFGGIENVLQEELKKLNIGRGIPSDAGIFDLGSGVKGDSYLKENSSLGSDVSSFSKLSNETRKLNLQNSGSDEGFEKTKQTDQRAKMDGKNNFMFGANTIAPSSFGGIEVNVLPDEMRNLNIGNEAPSQSTKGKAEYQPGSFIFGSNLKKSSFSSQTSFTSSIYVDKNTSSEINATKDLNTERSTDDDSFTRNEDMLSSFKDSATNEPRDFTFGSCSNLVDNSQQADASSAHAPTSFKYTFQAENQDPESNLQYGGSEFAFRSTHEGIETTSMQFGTPQQGAFGLHEIKKFNVSIKKENLVGDSGEVAASAADAPSSVKYTFQTRKQDASSRKDSIPPSETDESYGAATPLNPSSFSQGLRYGASSFAFTTMPDRKGTTSMKFRTPKQEAPGLSKESWFTAPHQKPAFSEKKGEAKSARTKKRVGKQKKSAPVHQTVSRPVFNRQESYTGKVEPESPGDYSPMDYSPYRENLADEQCTREASLASDEPLHSFSRYSSSESQKSHSIEDLVFATEHMIIDKRDKKPTEAVAENVNHAESYSDFGKETHLPSTGSLSFQFEDVDGNDDRSSATMESEIHHSSVNIERQTNEIETGYTFAPKLESFGESSFTFAASHFTQGPLSASKRHYRRKSKTRGAQAFAAPDLFPLASTSAQLDTSKDLERTSSVPQTVDDTRAETTKISHDRKESIVTDAGSLAAQEACEKWRIRGNQAYANGHFAKAEEYYSRGVNSISPSETSRSCKRALMLCYSNRAATRMSLGRMREALSDCMKAAAIEPSFLRAQVRAANCQLALGEIEDALKYFRKCLKSNTDACLDPKIITEATDGLEKAQRVSDCIIQSDELLPKRTPSEVARALELISDALLISTQSDNLMEMKAEALLMLRRYEEVIQFCEETLELAERNSLSHDPDSETKNIDSSQNVKSSSRLWRWRLISISYFYLGKLEEALELLKKHEQVKPVLERYGNRSTESASSFSDTVRELICLKAAGNEAFQASRHSEAVEHYTAALACSSESRPFAAVCFCNRAAAYQALGQITDAIADCSLAIALDPCYPKAISRRATLHEMIRDYGQAANDLCKLICLLDKQLQENQSGASGKSVSYNSDINRARGRLSSVEDEARKGIPLDMYLILGIEPSSSAADVKKAYRKAALRHHPDKAGQFLVRNENVDDVVWKEIAAGVHTDADRLFKMIGEAYTVLSDPTKRLQYDTEEELRIALKKGGSVSSTPKSAAEYYSSQYDKSSSRRQWRPYGSSYQHHRSEFSRSNR